MEHGPHPASSLSIDCSEDTFETGVAFWAAVFGATPRQPADAEQNYVELPGALPHMTVEVQRVGAPSRYHIDFPAEDVDAEVRRMVDLGAERVEQIESWWVMRAPTGHLFCVVPATVAADDTSA